MSDKLVSLPNPQTGKAESLEAVIASRRSIRKYAEGQLSELQTMRLYFPQG